MQLRFAAIAFVALSTSAMAADLPVKAPAIAPIQSYNWTGFYIGAQVGWSHIRDTQDLSSPTFALSVSDTANGIVGGVHAGYNLQMNQFVYGLEADFEGNSTDHSFAIGFPFVATTGTERLQWQGSLRGRLGLAWDRVFLYGTGGWAFGGFEDSYNTTGTVFAESVSSTRSGWTAGGGIEYAWLNNFTMRAEYRFTDWGSHTNALNVFLSPPGISVDHVRQSVVRVGVSYKF